MIDTTYNISLALSNENGTSPFSPSLSETTPPEGLSTMPLNVLTTPLSPTAITVSWDPPISPNGNPSYIIRYGLAESANITLPSVDPGVQSANLTGLMIFTRYYIAVSASTSCGESPPNEVSGISGETTPTEPSNLRVVAVLSTAIVIEWEEPGMPNGNIVGYRVSGQ